MWNNRDAFSHSEQCDQFFTGPVITHPCLSFFSILTPGVPFAVLANVPGTEQPHDKCQCWCHNAQLLFETPEPEYDLTPPPEYLSSADRAFVLDEPAHVRVGFSQLETNARAIDSSLVGSALGSGATDEYRGAVVLDSRSNEIEARPVLSSIDIHEGPANRTGFSRWSRKELTSGKCETCGDKLTDCECVE